MKLLLFPPVDAERLAQIRVAAGTMQVVNAATPAEAAAEIVDADAMFGKITPDLLARAQRLRWLQSATASLEHYMFPELAAHELTMTNMRGIYADVIADHVLGYILCFARNLHVYMRQQAECRYAPLGGETERSNFSQGTCSISGMDRAHMHLSDATLGIVGLGNIGREIARRASCFGMRILAVDPYQTEQPPHVAALWGFDKLADLLGQSDFVAIAAPHTPETEGLFDRELLRKMKRSGILINIGRGKIVKLDALVDALADGDLAGAALDVFEIEPLPADHPLWKHPNVIITPHVAACSVHLAERHLAVVLDNIRRFVAGEPLEQVVYKDKWF